jgi:hypothetical protein
MKMQAAGQAPRDPRTKTLYAFSALPHGMPRRHRMYANARCILERAGRIGGVGGSRDDTGKPNQRTNMQVTPRHAINQEMCT